MGPIAEPRESLDAARATFDHARRVTGAVWSDHGWVQFETRIAEPLSAALRHYAAALASIDDLAERSLSLLQD